MNCPTCGAPLETEVLFCPHCGTRIQPHSSASLPTINLASSYDARDDGSQASSSFDPALIPSQWANPQPVSVPNSSISNSTPNSSLAIISLVAGILSWLVVPIIGAVVAIIIGHIARREIRYSNGQLAGNGLALVGMILGYVQIAICFFIVVLLIGFFILVLGSTSP